MSRNQEIFVPPPQFYEFSRLQNFEDIRLLLEFSLERQNKGLTLYMPVQFQCTDGLALILPGDDAYPKQVLYVEEKESIDRSVDLTLEEFRGRSVNLNRNELRGPHDILIYSNVNSVDGHKRPLQLEEVQPKRANL